MTYLVNASLHYDTRNAAKPETPVRQLILDKFGEDFLGWGSDRVLDQQEVEWCEANDIKLEIRRIKGMTGFTGIGTSEVIKHVTQIAVPNIGLLTIDEVILMEDACTDALQGELDQGWRLLAICPPNSTRRPDYILGRTKKEA